MNKLNAHWDVPVIVVNAATGQQTVHGPFEALACLTEEWPVRDIAYVKARSACRGALAGHRAVEEARAEFEAAAQQARLEFDRRRN